MVQDDAPVFLKGYGLREQGKPGTVDAETVFQLASFSKPISATVVAVLVGERVVDWNSTIATLDPSFRLQGAYPTQQLTIRDLFAHRSGLPGDAGNELEALGYDRATILQRLALVPPSSSFRAGYSYSNFGLTEGAVAAAKPTGKAWEDVAQEKLYAPLGMTSTSSRHADFLKRDQPGGAAYRRARQMGGEAPARPGRAGAGGRRVLQCARPRAMAAAGDIRRPLQWPPAHHSRPRSRRRTNP